MDGKQFKDDCWRILNRAAIAYEDDRGRRPNEYGARHFLYYKDIDDAERIIAHMIERGFMEPDWDEDGLKIWNITDAGRAELERLRNPTDPAETLRAEIAALERQLADKRAALGALESGERPDSEALVNRGIASQFHEG